MGEEAIDEILASTNTTKKEVVPAGPPWSLIGTFDSFDAAAAKRRSIKDGYTKIRARTDGTFTVHTRDMAPGKKKSK